jgi:hypothetical protein
MAFQICPVFCGFRTPLSLLCICVMLLEKCKTDFEQIVRSLGKVNLMIARFVNHFLKLWPDSYLQLLMC